MLKVNRQKHDDAMGSSPHTFRSTATLQKGLNSNSASHT
jgi:hypothetical protein